MPLASGTDYLYVENGPRAPVEPKERKLVRVSKTGIAVLPPWWLQP